MLNELENIYYYLFITFFIQYLIKRTNIIVKNRKHILETFKG